MSTDKDSGQNDMASLQDDSRSQNDSSSWTDDNGDQNDLVPEHEDGIGQDRVVSFEDNKELVRQIPLDDYGAAQNGDMSSIDGSIDQKGAVLLYRDDGPIDLTPSENRHTAHVGVANNADSDMAVFEIDNGSGLIQADENRQHDGAVACDNHGNRRNVQENSLEYPGITSIQMITDRTASDIQHVIHIRSLASEYFKFSETVEVWAWPLPDAE